MLVKNSLQVSPCFNTSLEINEENCICGKLRYIFLFFLRFCVQVQTAVMTPKGALRRATSEKNFTERATLQFSLVLQNNYLS